ncbi:hypothetical protein [Megamonas funiformis]|uniref:hypothetical protein n=1 Tax=Megamonas funiformis TaxID=437897 RepID=UPI003F87F8E7
MILKYGAEIDKSAIDKNLNRITNQIYKLLPSREEKSDWQKPLTTIIEELAGMDRLLFDQHEILFPLLCKLEGLFLLSEDKDFFLYRRTIFECLGLINNIKI